MGSDWRDERKKKREEKERKRGRSFLVKQSQVCKVNQRKITNKLYIQKRL